MMNNDLPDPQDTAGPDPEQAPNPRRRLHPRLDDATMRRFEEQARRLGIRSRPHAAAAVVLTTFALSDEVFDAVRRGLHLVVLDPPSDDDPSDAAMPARAPAR